MATIVRTIYTQGAAYISGDCTNLRITGAPLWFTGIQSANYTKNSPKIDVASMGALGSVAKIQVEPTVASLEIALAITTGALNATYPNFLSALCANTNLPSPSGMTVACSGVGLVSGAVLSSFRMEATMGAIPQLQLTFDGFPGPDIYQATAPPTVVTSVILPVVTPYSVGLVNSYWLGGWVTTVCPQTVRASWEMPIERVNCIGGDVDFPTVFSRPPGTMSIVIEGLDRTFLDSGKFLTGVQIGAYTLACTNSGVFKETSRSASLAVGEVGGSFNITAEGQALSAIIAG
jgi:hypothetical protein